MKKWILTIIVRIIIINNLYPIQWLREHTKAQPNIQTTSRQLRHLLKNYSPEESQLRFFRVPTQEIQLEIGTILIRKVWYNTNNKKNICPIMRYCPLDKCRAHVVHRWVLVLHCFQHLALTLTWRVEFWETPSLLNDWFGKKTVGQRLLQWRSA